MKKILLLLVASISVSLSATNTNAPKSTNEQSETAITIEASASWYIKTDCFAATTESAFDELTRACNRKDQDAVMRMVQRGTVAVLSKGTSVDMVKYGFAKCRIQVLSGSYRGSYLYIASEFVDSK